jgi:hypothetical protein
MGAPDVRKQALMMRLNFVATRAPTYSVLMNTDFEVNPIYSAAVSGAAIGSLWDGAYWDVDLWAGGRAAFGEWRSVVGLGYALAPSIFLSAQDRTTLASIEYMVKNGGPL